MKLIFEEKNNLGGQSGRGCLNGQNSQNSPKWSKIKIVTFFALDMVEKA